MRLIAKLESGYTNHCGHTIPEWICHLLKEDRSESIGRFSNKFVKHVGADENGWETRFARKFGYVYAALKVALAAGLLPWPAGLPLKVVTKCYRKARTAAQTEQERGLDLVHRIDKLIRQGRVVEVSNGDAAIEITNTCIAIRYKKLGRTKYGLLDDALLKLAGTRKVKLAFTDSLSLAGVIAVGHGHAGTVQEHFKIIRGGKLIQRPRVWSIDARELKAFIRESK